MNTFRVWIKQNAFATFLVLTFIISWSWWPLYVQGTVPMAVFPTGPMLAALIVVSLAYGSKGIKEWLRTGFKWRVRPIWYVIAVGFPLVLTGIPAAVNILLGATPSMAGYPTSPVDFLAEAAFVFILVAMGEEMGFSAFALPHLLRRQPVLTTVVILGLTRSLWHLPLIMTGDTQWPVAILLFPTQLIFTWIFIRTGGSALMMILSHMSIATLGSTFFTNLFSGPELTQVVWLQAAAFVIAGIILLLTSDFWRAGSYVPETAGEDEVQAAVIR